MIPKAEVLAVAEEAGLLPTTVEKDYVLGWVLFAIAEHAELSRWDFKGGTCLKKCYVDTYRFSEDLDFTIREGSSYDDTSIRSNLRSIAAWVGENAGIDISTEAIDVRESVNRRGEITFAARMTFVGPLQMPRAERQRIRFDLTRDELVVAPPELREVFHGYSDVPDPLPRMRCYSLADLLAEKVRALLERSGRARDVYDVVNVGRNLREELSAPEIAGIAERKFRFKELDPPTPEGILARVDPDVLETDWIHALRHQLPVLPPVRDFVAGLREVLEWIFAVTPHAVALSAVPGSEGERAVPPVRFARHTAGRGVSRAAPPSAYPWPSEAFGGRMDRIRYAARNRLLVRVSYHGVERLVEPYALRMPRTGNLLFYVYEVQQRGGPVGGIKAFKVAELGDVHPTDQPFQARHLVEL